MVETWLLLNSGPGPAAANMAADEALLEFAFQIGVPVFRLYGWTEPAGTFGYFQRYTDVASWTKLRPLLRRPTGGGLVPHDADWTYSLIFPPAHPWHALRAWESYRRVHEWICAAFAAMGLRAELSPGQAKAVLGQCFVGAEKFDVLWDGAKIAGAAQRRNRFGLLIQGSVQARDLPVSRDQWSSLMLNEVPWPERPAWNSFTQGVPPSLAEEISRRSQQLETEKYSQASYNEGR